MILTTFVTLFNRVLAIRRIRPALWIGLGLSLSACGTAVVVAIPDNNAPYHNLVSQALTMTANPPTVSFSASPAANDMAGMVMMNTTEAAAVVTALPSATGPTPTDYILYNILYPTSTGAGQSVSGANSGLLTMQATEIATAIATPDVTSTLAPTAVAASRESSALQYSAPLNGNAANGKVLFNQVGCSGCHNVAVDSVLVGPSLKGIAVRAATRKSGYTAIEYLRESILAPNAYIVPGFNPNVMTQTFGQQLSKQQIDDLLAYLLTLGN